MVIYIVFLILSGISCNPEVMFNYEIRSNVPLEFKQNGMNYEVLKKEEKEHQPRKESESVKESRNMPTFKRNRVSPPRGSPPRRKSPSPPRNNKLVDDDSSFLGRVFGVFVPNSSVNRNYCDLASDNSYLWDDV